jgi:predicted AAA+ superfamily ATPase
MDKNTIFSLLEKYNFWDGNMNNLGYQRVEYLDIISVVTGVGSLIKVLIWQRRAGKSYILKQFISRLIQNENVPPKNILYLNLEYDDFSFIRTKDELKTVFDIYRENLSTTGKVYLFIDEIQEIEWWEKFINSVRADHTRDIDIYITGSNSSLLSSELATYLSGRYIAFPIYPFSFQEYLSFRWGDRNKMSLLEYMNFSGIPELYNLPNRELQKSFISSLKDTIILKDLVKRYAIKEVDLLEKIFFFLSSNVWNLFSINAIARKLHSEWISISPNTLSNYLRYLQNILVFYGVDRYDLKWKRILEWEKKYYLNDLGFVNFLFSSFDNYAGKKLENYVYTALIQHGYSVFVWNMWDKEIDFVAEKEGRKIYVQVAYLLFGEEVIEREYGNLRLIKDSFPKYVVSLDDIALPVDDYGIEHVQAWNIEKIL